MPTPLSRALLLGAAFDALFAVAILAVPGWSASVLGIDLPPDRVYLDLVGVLLAILAGIYVAASRSPGRYAAVAPVSAAGRLLGCAVLTHAWAGGHPRAFLILGIADLVLAVVTAGAWWRERALSA